ncbi:MAG: leucine-rich repeat domain-containing protein [Treponema sp.]
MKKTFLFLSFCILLISVNIFAEKKKSDSEQEKYFAMAKVPPLTDFKYELTDDLDGIKITAYEGEDVHIRIPDTIEDMPVVELGGYLFFNKNVEAVIMPDTIKKVGDKLFLDCTSLKYVKLSTALKSLKAHMFCGCESLEEFNIPDHITNIERNVFMDSGLKSIYIPDTVTSFFSIHKGHLDPSGSIFANCKNLQKVRLPDSLTEIPVGMFSGCTALSSITLPKGITEIGK